MTAALVAEGVKKSYGEVTALDGVSLEIESGEVFGLVGPNGAGKTTLVRALTGTTRAEGRVRVLDADPTAVERSRIGLLPQSFSPAGRLTPRELLAQYAGRYDRTRDPDAVLSDVGIDGTVRKQWYETLSGGQKRRVCVAIALVNDPEVLFLDEPTTGIDPAGRRALWALLEDLAAGGTTVFLTSHSMAEVERLSDRVGFLTGGRLVAVGTPRELIDAHGGRSRLVVGTDGDEANDGVFDGLHGEFEVSSRAGRVVVEGVGPRDIDTVVAAFDDRGISVASLTWTQPDLGDVYLALTGDSFAGDAGSADGRPAR